MTTHELASGQHDSEVGTVAEEPAGIPGLDSVSIGITHCRGGRPPV